MRKQKFLATTLILIISILLAGPSLVAFARSLTATDPGLGTSADFSVLATTAVTNSGTSNVDRSVGVFAGTQIDTGINTGGAQHSADGVAAQAVSDATAAGLNMESQALTANIGPALDGLTLVPGVYDIGAGQLNGGTLTLDGPGVYIFRASSSFLSAGTISLINGARACDVYWRVQSLATINGSTFVGTIIAGTGVHFGANVTLDGRAMAINGDVTLISDNIVGPSCAAVAVATTKPRKTAVPAIGGLPNTGGAPIRHEDSPWGPLLATGIAAAVLASGIMLYRRSHLPKQ